MQRLRAAFAERQREELYLACYPPEPGGWRSRTALAYRMIDRRRERMVLDALEDLAGYLGELREERKAVLVVTDGWPLYLPDERMLQRRADDVAPRLPLGPPDTDRASVISSETGTRQLSAAARRQCEADRATLATLDHSRRLQEIAARANRANVSFYPIAPAGLIAERRGLTPAGQVRRDAERRGRGTFPIREHTTLFALQTWRRGPSTGPQYVPAADLRFRRNERLRLELPAEAGTSVSARLIDRTGSPLPVPVSVADREDDPSSVRWIVLDVVLAPLAPGEYALDVAHGDARQVTAFRIVP